MEIIIKTVVIKTIVWSVIIKPVISIPVVVPVPAPEISEPSASESDIYINGRVPVTVIRSVVPVIRIIEIGIIPSVIIIIACSVPQRAEKIITHCETQSTRINTYTPCKWPVIIPVGVCKNRGIVVKQYIIPVEPVYPG